MKMLFLDSRYNFLIPYNVPMIRIGHNADGGYVVAKRSLEAKNLISFGLGKDWSFEKQWLDLNPHSFIHVYDGTVFPEAFQETLKSDYQLFFKSPVTHFRENVHPGNIELILNKLQGSAFLKVDIEGAEYDLIPYIAKAQNIIGITIEFHTLDSEYRSQQFKSTIDLLHNFKIVHIHANNFGGVNIDKLPHTLEISFLRQDLCSSSSEKRYHSYLEGLDAPNSLNNIEYSLYFIGEKNGC